MSSRKDASVVSTLIQQTKDWLCNRCIAHVIGMSDRKAGEITRHLQCAQRYYLRSSGAECSSCGEHHLCIRPLGSRSVVGMLRG